MMKLKLTPVFVLLSLLLFASHCIAEQSVATETVISQTENSGDQIQKNSGLQQQNPVNGKTGILTSVDEKAVTQIIDKIKEQASINTTGDVLQVDEAFLPEYTPPDLPALKIFGHDFFSASKKDTFQITSMPSSTDYVLGPDDEIEIHMWGRLDSSNKLTVNKDGIIVLPKIGPITVSGLTFGEVEALVTKRVGAISGVKVSVSMGKLKSIQVFVLGDINFPGIYTVKAMSTIINALYAAGGPKSLGTLRNVTLQRSGNVISTLDLYGMLLKGDMSEDRLLQPGDIIFVTQTGPMVSMSGDLRRPAVYELKDDFTLKTAIALAGGMKPTAYKKGIQVRRAHNNEEQIVIDVTDKDLQGKEKILLQDGDFVTISKILPSPINSIYLFGNVIRPGEYAYRQGLRVLDILPDVGSLARDTHFGYGLIRRYRSKDMVSEIITFDLGKLLISGMDSENLLLQPLDEIYVFNKDMFEDRAVVKIEGQVRKPGQYPIGKLSIRDLIHKAGGLKDDAHLSRAEMIRTDRNQEKVTSYFDVAKVLADDPKQNIPLKDGDRIVIHSIWEEKPKPFVTIKGAVNKPGEYELTKGMAIKDLIYKGANPAPGAYLERAELVRFDIVNGEKVNVSLIPFNVSLALGGDPGQNKSLQPHDIVYIRAIPDWQNKEIHVTVSGETRSPGTYRIMKNERLADIIKRAGGYTTEAFLPGAVFIRESAKEQQQQLLNDMIQRLEIEITSLASLEGQALMTERDITNHIYFITAKKNLLSKLREQKPTGRVVISLKSDSESQNDSHGIVLENGDSLHIPKEPQTINVLGAVFHPSAYTYDRKHPKTSYYMRKTGGPVENADESQIYIIRTNGTVVSKRSLKGSFESTELLPGDTIMVPFKGMTPGDMNVAPPK